MSTRETEIAAAAKMIADAAGLLADALEQDAVAVREMQGAIAHFAETLTEDLPRDIVG